MEMFVANSDVYEKWKEARSSSLMLKKNFKCKTHFLIPQMYFRANAIVIKIENMLVKIVYKICAIF